MNSRTRLKLTEKAIKQGVQLKYEFYKFAQDKILDAHYDQLLFQIDGLVHEDPTTEEVKTTMKNFLALKKALANIRKIDYIFC